MILLSLALPVLGLHVCTKPYPHLLLRVLWFELKSSCFYIKCSYPLSHPSYLLCLLFVLLSLIFSDNHVMYMLMWFMVSCFYQVLHIFLQKSFVVVVVVFKLYIPFQSALLSKKYYSENSALKDFFICQMSVLSSLTFFFYLGKKQFIVLMLLKMPS